MIINKIFKPIFIITTGLFFYECSVNSIVLSNSIDENNENSNELISDSIITETTKYETEENYVEEKQIWKDITYSPTIETILLFNINDELSYPVYNLNSNDKIVLKFDDLSTTIKDYHYSIYKCKRDWTSSDLDEMEYIDGFQDNPIEQYKNSYNTFVPYVHYNLSFPNEDIKLIKSGNYRIVVYENGQINNPAFSKNFYVTENNIGVFPKLKQTADMETHDYQQEIDVDLNISSADVSNPYESIQLIIEQNNFKFESCKDLSANFIREGKITYNREDCNVFWGGNEFHNLDLTAIRLNSEFEANRTNYGNTVTLPIDQKRTYKKYLEQSDIDGKFKIRIQNGNEEYNHIEADYINVLFTLSYPYQMDKDIYIIGGLTNWQLDDRFLMEFNDEKRQYECKVLMKQGYYNYLYTEVSNSDNESEIKAIEGAHYETQNSYIIKVYYSDPQNFYDRLLSFSIFNSRDI